MKQHHKQFPCRPVKATPEKFWDNIENKGIAPIVIILVVVALLGMGAGVFVLVSKNKTPSLPSPSPSNQAPETETSSPQAAANPTELLGWWEEEGGFPFLKEFTNEYFCNQYSSRSTCVDNVRYRVEGNKIFVELEWLSGHPYATWKMVGDKLELTSADSPSKTLYKKISEPTSPNRKLPGSLQANLELIKANKSGICLRHNGGDIVYVGDIELTVDGKNIPVSTFGQFPKFEDLLFSSGEALVLPGTFNAGSKVSIKLARNILGTTPSFATTESGSWTIERLVVEPFPNSVSAPFWFGFASCP